MDMTNGGEPPRLDPRIAETRKAESNESSLDDVIRSLASNPAGGRKEVMIGPNTYKLVVPETWVGVKDKFPELPGKAMTEFHPPGNPDLQIAVLYRGRPENEQAGEKFHRLLAANADLKLPKVLTPEQIKDLNPIMGYVIGDNQYKGSINPLYGPGKFHLSTAKLMSVNGKTVLAAEGELHDRAGKTLSYFSGVFIDSDGTGRNVHEIFLQTQNSEDFEKSKPIFQNTLKSVEWN